MKYPLILFILAYSGLNAQVFPVQVTPQLIPPYSPYLSDYTAPGAQNFVVQVRANDITLADYPCRLRITIEGPGITLRTKENFIPQPLLLEGGIPQVLYGEDLHEYFHPDALDFSGLTRREYEKSARLPEGVYRFTAEVLDYNRGTVVSNQGMAMAWIILNDPPLLNQPANLSKVKVEDPTNIFFSWTPRHSGSPNAAFTTEYIFRLVEIWPENRNPYDAFLTQGPLYETTTTQNQVLYGITEPALLPGRKYAWQVEARDTGGKDLFKNKGRSEVFVFQFGDALAIPEDLRMRWAKPTTLAIQWNAVKANNPEEIKYRLTYRPRKRIPDHEWYETRTKFTEKTLYHLQPGTEYEMKVRTEDAVQESEYTETRIFKTLPEEAEAFVCREVPPPPLPDNTLPVFPLMVNDTIHAGGYNILVRDVIEVNGKYFGSGMAIVPWFNAARVRVTFENIRVNDRFWLTSGLIRSIWNSGSRFLMEEQAPVSPGNAPQAGELDITVVSSDSLILVEGAVQGTAIITVTRNEEGDIVITTTDGGEQTLEKGHRYAIVDDLGNGYIVDKEGNIAKTTATAAVASAARGDRHYDLTVGFVKGNGRFGFDEKKYEALSPYYQQLDNGVFVSWKALSSSMPDAVEGHLRSGDTDLQTLRFEAGGTPVTPASVQGDKVVLNLHGKAAGLEEELLALYKRGDTIPDKVLGKVNLVTYDPVHYNLVIVPVNDAPVPGGISAYVISGSLNNVFHQAVVEWKVSIAQRIHVPLGETFDEGETGVFSNYTDDMKKVLGAWGRLEENTYYLFLINEPRNMATLGYMPRNKRAGFVFVAPHQGNTEDFLKTIAHELGHGAFNLKHTFSEHNLPSGTTDNLMDYSEGTRLCKYQWDQIHEPQGVMGLFEGDEEGASVIVTNLSQLKEFANKDGTFTFLAPTGIPFTLPASTQSVIFWTNDVYPDGVIPADDSPDGALIAFTIENKTYQYHKIEGEKFGTGYKTQNGDLPYIDAISKNNRDLRHAIIGLPCVEGGQLNFIAQRVLFESGVPEENYSAEGEVVTKLPIEDPYGPYFSSRKITLDAKLNFNYTEEAKSFISDNQACLNEMVRFVIKAADVIQRHPGYYELYKVCRGGSLEYPQGGSTSTEDAFKMGIYYEKLKGFADELLQYIHESRYAHENLLNIEDPDALGDLLTNTCEPDFRLFTFDQRKHILEVLSQGNLNDYWLSLGNNRENIVIYTLQQAPKEQHADILDLLKNNSYALLKTLIAKSDNQLIGEDNFDRLIDAITVMVQKEYVYENIEEDITNDRILRWGSTGFLHSFVYECPDWITGNKDKIVFSHTSTSLDVTGIGEIAGTISVIPEEKVYPPLEVSPFDFVPLKLYSDIQLDNGTPILKRSAGEMQAIPAIYLYWMIHRKATDETLAYIKANVNMLLFIVGGAEVMAARSALRLTLAITDQALFATSFVLAAGPRQMLEQGPNGEEWKKVFKAFDAFNLLYGAARLGQGVSLAAKDLAGKKELIRHLKQTEDWNHYTPSQQNLIKEELAKVEKGVDELERLLGTTVVADQSANLAGVLNKLSRSIQDRVKLLPSKQMDDLLSDLNSSPGLLSRMTIEMVDGWEVLASNSVLRKRVENLEVIGKWVNKGVEKQTFLNQIGKAHAKQKIIDQLHEAKSTVHVQVIIKDYENIPGVVRGRYVSNSSSITNKQNLPVGWDESFDLPIEDMESFTGVIEATELGPGDIIYRVSGPYGIDGRYWTKKKPNGLIDVIGGTAIKPQWNNFEYLSEYSIPEGAHIKCWIGKTARQKIGEANSNYFLPGGTVQLFIPSIAKQDKNFSTLVKSRKTSW